MLKFDLARKYLVGLLTVAMVFSLFVMPISAQPSSPTVNAGVWGSIDLTRSPAVASTDNSSSVGDTITSTATTRDAAGGLSGTGTVYFRIQDSGGAVLYSKSDSSSSPTGTWTAAFAWVADSLDDYLDPGITYYLVAWWDYDSDGVWDQGYEPMSAALDVRWETPYIKTISPTQGTVGTSHENNVTKGQTTHTITVEVKDQFGDLVASDTLNYQITGSNPKTSTTAINSGIAVISYSNSDNTAASSGVLGQDTIVLNYGGDYTATFYKTWTYIPYFDDWTIDPNSDINTVGTTHTVTVTFLDQYDYPVGVTATVLFGVTGSNTQTATKAGTGSRLTFTYTGVNAGQDTITATAIVNGQTLGSKSVGKTWYYPPNVEPDDAVNLLGTPHEFLFYGAPEQHVRVTLSSAGIFNLENLFVTDIESPSYTIWHAGWQYNILPFRASLIDCMDIQLDESGTAAVTVKAEAPGKFYLEANFYADTKTTTIVYTEKVAKCYAKFQDMVLTPTLDINPITQQTKWDIHTVIASILGHYPVTKNVSIPPTEPPLGGRYIIVGDELWVVDAPIANVPVDWKVSWTDTVVARDSADRVTTSTYYFTATSVSDENGEAPLTYFLKWTGSATGTGSCTYFFPCLIDTITATAQYPEPALTGQLGSFTRTATKEWRDYPFKLIKYNGHLPIGPGDYIPNATFFLKINNKTITGTTATVTYTQLPYGNAYQQLDLNKLWLVTTDSAGVALFFHLPFGTYYLWEYDAPPPYGPLSSPVYTGITFTIDKDTTWWWCNPTGEKIKVEYYVNTPTNPDFYKVTYCGTKVVGAVFDVTNLTTGEKESFTSDANGKVVIDLSLFSPAFNSVVDTVYKVHEVSTGSAVDCKPVDDFYFYLNNRGIWDGVYYADEDCNVEGWKPASYPWAWYTGSRLWVIDPKIGTEPPPAPVTATVTFNTVQGWNMVTPGVISTKTAAQIFGANFVHAYHWDPTLPGPDGSLGGWLFCDNQALVPGLGYWVRMSAASTVALNGTPVASPVTQAISKPWEQFGNPFETALSVANVKIVQGATEKSLADAKAAGWIGNAYSWNGTSYDTLDYSTGTLPAGKGFWLRVLVDGLSIKFTK